MVLNKKIETLSIVELFKSVRTILQDWKFKTPYQKWCYFYSIGKFAFKLGSVPLYEIDQTLNWYSYTALGYIGLYTMLVLYTAVFYINSGEFMKFLPSTCFATILLAVSIQNSDLLPRKFYDFEGCDSGRLIDFETIRRATLLSL